jgi:AsmA protein
MGTTKPKRARRFIIGALIVVGALAALAAAVPLVISADVVKHRIVDQITYWTGRDFSFRGDPHFSLYPYLTVRLRNATLGNADGKGDEPFVEMDAMTGKLEILPLLLGRLEFAEFRLVNPRINLVTDAGGRGNWILDEGAVGSQLSKGDKQGITDEIEPPSPFADIKLGRLVIRDGIVSYTDNRSGRKEELTKVNVSFDWSSTSQAAAGTGSFIWRGEPVQFNGGIDAPLALLAGGSSPVRFAFTATPLKLAFTGSALQLDGTQLEGDVNLTTPSVRRVIEWMGAPMGTGAILGAGSIAGKINWLGPSVAIADAKMELDGNVAEGALSATVGGGGLSSLQGTLAFESLDLSPYIEALRAKATAGGSWLSAPARLPLGGVSDIDLRVSTNQLVIGTATIGHSAATAILKDGQLALTIGEAQIGDGDAEAHVAVKLDNDALVGDGQIRLSDLAVGDALGQFAGLTGLDGVATATLDFGVRGRTWGEVVDGLAGKATVAIANGVFQGANLANLPAALKDPDNNSVAGSTAFAAATCTLNLANGVITTEDFEAKSDAFALRLAGSAGLLDPSIEARGVLTVADAGNDSGPTDVPFRIGGTWMDWHLLPDLGPPIERGAITPEPGVPPSRSPNG